MKGSGIECWAREGEGVRGGEGEGSEGAVGKGGRGGQGRGGERGGCRLYEWPALAH